MEQYENCSSLKRVWGVKVRCNRGAVWNITYLHVLNWMAKGYRCVDAGISLLAEGYYCADIITNSNCFACTRTTNESAKNEHFQ